MNPTLTLLTALPVAAAVAADAPAKPASAITQAPNGTIYVHYDRNRGTDAEILFARCREEDVKAGRLDSPGSALKDLVKSRAHGMNRGGAR